MRWLLALSILARALAGGTAADLARSIREIELDPEECYRVRELTLVREDIRFYLTDGYLIFGKPVAGRRVAALFTTGVEGGDAEVIVMPPSLGERRSLASYTGSPNMVEHISGGILVFSDNTWQELTAQIRANPFNRKVPEAAPLESAQWSEVLRNIAGSFETRLVLDLIAGGNTGGFLGAALVGRKLGNFDVLYDPRLEEQVLVGQVVSRDNRVFFDTWTSFPALSWRKGARQAATEFTLRDYRIEATLEPSLNLRTVCRVKVVPGEQATRVLPFELTGAMRISSVTVDGKPAEVLQRDSLRANLVRNTGNDLVLVAPAEALTAGAEHEFVFHAEGRVVHEAGNQVYFVGARANWYPNRQLQFATYDLTFRYPSEFDLVTAGNVVEDREEGPWRITRRRVDSPIRLAGFNLGHYDKARITRGHYSVEVYANRTLERALERPPVVFLPPPSAFGRPRQQPGVVMLPQAPEPTAPRTRLADLASEVAATLEFMAARFGPPAVSTLTVSPVPGAFGQGFPGLVYLSTLAYLKPQDKTVRDLAQPQQLFFTDLLQAHETAHQWWGNVVVPAGYHDDWLMEALANYSALLYLEKRKGIRTFESILEDYRSNLLSKAGAEIMDAAGPVVLGSRLESSQTPQAWRTVIYGKGSWILHMLRRRMGDERFFDMLAGLRRRYEWKSVSTEQFRALAAGYLPPKSPDADLGAFFDQYVYGTGIPTLKLSHSVKRSGKALRLQGTLTQSDVSADFSVPVPIEIQFGRGKPITHVVHSEADPVTFTVPLKQAPTKVVLDPQWSVLRR